MRARAQRIIELVFVISGRRTKRNEKLILDQFPSSCFMGPSGSKNYNNRALVSWELSKRLHGFCHGFSLNESQRNGLHKVSLHSKGMETRVVVNDSLGFRQMRTQLMTQAKSCRCLCEWDEASVDCGGDCEPILSS